MSAADLRSRPIATVVAVGATVAAIASSAGAAPTAVDLHLDIVVGASPTTGRPVPNGGTATVRGLSFAAGVDVSLVTALPASATVRFTLPEGLTWGRDLPDPTESCTSTASTGECQTPPARADRGPERRGLGMGRRRRADGELRAARRDRVRLGA